MSSISISFFFAIYLPEKLSSGEIGLLRLVLSIPDWFDRLPITGVGFREPLHSDPIEEHLCLAIATPPDICCIFPATRLIIAFPLTLFQYVRIKVSNEELQCDRAHYQQQLVTILSYGERVALRFRMCRVPKESTETCSYFLWRSLQMFNCFVSEKAKVVRTTMIMESEEL